MVPITPEAVESFKKIFKKEYGVDYSDKEAWEATHSLVGLFDLLLKVDRRLQKQKGEQQNKVTN